MVWKWVASFILTAVLILPILPSLASSVKERENHMKDLLQISGLVEIAYWASYVIVCEVLSQAMIWITIGILGAGQIFTTSHVGPYVALMTCFSLSLIAYLLAFGFVVFRSEYFSLPSFLLSVGLCVGGDYLANHEDISIGTKREFNPLIPAHPSPTCELIYI
jgi:hypothetical protein